MDGGTLAARAVAVGSVGRGGDGRDDERPRSTDPGLIDDEDEADDVGENQWLDVLEKKTFEMGMNQSGMKMGSLMTGEEDLPRVAAVINVGLRPRRIWNVLIVAVVMSGLDRGKDSPVMVGPTAVGVGLSTVTASFIGDGSVVATSGGGCWRNGGS
ncbi:hypothetical protein ACLOJK_041408, partial [Asimina triloba]